MSGAAAFEQKVERNKPRHQARYKQTEVGLIPSDWDVKSLKQVCKLINGRGFKPFEWRSSGLPIIRIQNLNGSNEFNYFDGQYDRKLEVPSGQLLFAWSGSRGTSFGPHIWTGPLGLLNYHTWKVQIDPAVVTQQFLHHKLRQLTSEIEGWAHGAAALVHVQKWEMEGFPLAVPPSKREQDAIAEALSDADALIESLEQLIAKKRAIKQGAMQELLTGKRRLPGFKGPWSEVTLGELMAFKNGLNKAKEFFGHGTPIVNYMDAFRSAALKAETVLGRVSLTSAEIQNFDVRRGDILFTRTSETQEEIGMASVVMDDPRNTTFSGFLLRGRPLNDRLQSPFAAYWLRSIRVREQIISKASYTTRALTNGRILSAVSAELPDREEQLAISHILSDMDAEVNALEVRLSKARAVKQGMMQQLLTGRVRLI